MTGDFTKKGNLETVTHTGRLACKVEGRDKVYASISQGMPTISSRPPEARGEIWNRCFVVVDFLQLSQGTNSTYVFDLGLLFSRTVRQYISVVLNHFICGTLLQQSWKTNILANSVYVFKIIIQLAFLNTS